MKTPQFYLLALSGVTAMAVSALAQPQLQTLWSLDPGSRSYLPAAPGDNGQRGVAFNPVTGNVLLVSRTDGLSVNILDGLTGADKGRLNVSGISGGTFALNQIAVAADGAVYAANLMYPTDPEGADPARAFKVYRWADEGATPTLVYSGFMVRNTRWGDTMDVRGSGSDTEVLFSQGGTDAGRRIAVFTSLDEGVSFTPTIMTVSDLPAGESRGGVAFGWGDTVFTKNTRGRTLYYCDFDGADALAQVSVTAVLPESLSGYSALGTWMDEATGSSLLAAVSVNIAANPQTTPHQLWLFDMADPAHPVVLDSEPFVTPGQQNSNGAGAVDFDGQGRLIALDTNNGLRCYALIPEPASWVLFGLGLAALWRRRQRR